MEIHQYYLAGYLQGLEQIVADEALSTDVGKRFDNEFATLQGQMTMVFNLLEDVVRYRFIGDIRLKFPVLKIDAICNGN